MQLFFGQHAVCSFSHYPHAKVHFTGIPTKYPIAPFPEIDLWCCRKWSFLMFFNIHCAKLGQKPRNSAAIVSKKERSDKAFSVDKLTMQYTWSFKVIKGGWFISNSFRRVWNGQEEAQEKDQEGRCVKAKGIVSQVSWVKKWTRKQDAAKKQIELGGRREIATRAVSWNDAILRISSKHAGLHNPCVFFRLRGKAPVRLWMYKGETCNAQEDPWIPGPEQIH